ncbi:hypothetical protein CL634_06540 [bacterium]|nr:hypothetical protein [bacterium]
MKTKNELLLEGGAGGHMKHPFELNTVRTGGDLKDFFFTAAEYLQTKPGATKIDGTNVSFKLVGQEEERRQFAVDRGSLKEIDVNGVTIDRVSERFPPGESGEEHGMVRMCGMTLRILNSAIEEIQPELEALGMWSNPSIYINAEFVEGTTNVTKYDYNFLALHIVQQFYEKPANTKTAKGKPTHQMPRPGLRRPIITVVDDDTGEEREEVDKKIKSKILTKEDGIDPKALDKMVKKLRPFAEKFNFKVYSKIPTQIKQPAKGEPPVILEKKVKEALQERFTVNTSGASVTNTLEQWLSIMDSKNGTNSIPKLAIIPTPSGKTISPLSKACYLHISTEYGDGRPVEEMILGIGKGLGPGEKDILRTAEKVEKDFSNAIFGAVVTEATRVLGNAIMDGLQTEDGLMGDMSGHEGIVLQDEKFAGGGFVKITGQFIVDTAMGGGFGSKPVVIHEDEPLSPEEKPLNTDPSAQAAAASHTRRLVVFPGKFKPPHKGHLGLVEALIQHLRRPRDKVLILISPLSVTSPDGREISVKDSKNVWRLYLQSRGLLDKVKVLVSGTTNSPVRAAYAIADNEVDGFETLSGDFIIPGASTKSDSAGAPDWNRFAKFHEYDAKVEGVILGGAEEWAVAPITDDAGESLSATDFRAAVDNKEDISRWIPEGITEESFYAALISNQQNEGLSRFKALMESASDGAFQKRMKKRLKGAHARLLDKGGQKNTEPFTVKRPQTSNAFLAEEEIDEISAMGGSGGAPGDVQGGLDSQGKRDDAVKTKKTTIYNTWKKSGTKAMSYEDFAEEIKLRKTVKENLKWIRKEVLSKNRGTLLERIRLQNIVRELICEVAVEDSTADPHENTGINKLDILLRNIIPTLEEDYKVLTTSPEQRSSFRAHILHAIKHLLAPSQAVEKAGEEASTGGLDALQEGDLNIDIDAPDEEKFIDIKKDEKDAEEEKNKDPVEDFGIEGEDETGRNAAFDCFQKIEKQILKAFKLLGNDVDRELFYDYLLTNVKLYFDQFEKDLKKTLGEPTTDEYEAEKDQLEEPGLEEPEFDAGEELPGEGEEEMRAAAQ